MLRINIQTNKQTDSKILPTPTDIVGVGKAAAAAAAAADNYDDDDDDDDDVSNYRTNHHQVSWLEPNSRDQRQTGRTVEQTPRTKCTSSDLPACVTSRRPRQRAPRSRDRGRGHRRCQATGGTWRRSLEWSAGDVVQARTVWLTWMRLVVACWAERAGMTTACQPLNLNWHETWTNALLIHLHKFNNTQDEKAEFN